METKEIEDAVKSIEQDIADSSGVEYFNMTLTTNGFCQRVDFIGVGIWDSDSDERTYADENDETTIEPIEQHLRRVLREYLSTLGLIKV